MGRGAAPCQTSRQVFKHFLSPGNPGREWGGCLCCIFKMRANKRFVQGEESSRGQGREGSLKVKKHSTGFFGCSGNVTVGTKSSIQEKSQIMDSADRLNGLCVG